MEQNINPVMIPGAEPSNKKSLIVFIVIGVVVVILIGLGVWYWQGQKDKALSPSVNIPATPGITQLPPASPSVTGEDSTPVINQELNNIGINDLNKEFQSIDADLQVL